MVARFYFSLSNLIAVLSLTGFPYIKVPSWYIWDPKTPMAPVERANRTKEITTWGIDTFPIDTLMNIAIKELKGTKDAILSSILYGVCILNMDIKKDAIKIIVIGVALVDISSVLDTKAPIIP